MTRALCVLGLVAAALAGVTAQTEQTREGWQRVADLFAAAGVHAGASIADVGAGEGFLTVRLSPAVGPSGAVYAVDVDTKMTDGLRQRVAAARLTNVKVTVGADDDPHLPASALDGVLIVNAYHEMTAHEAMLSHVMSALKQGGVVVVMDGMWDQHESRSRDEQVKFHELAPTLARREVEKAGFEIVETRDPFIERAPDRDGKSRWWALIARKPAR